MFAMLDKYIALFALFIFCIFCDMSMDAQSMHLKLLAAAVSSSSRVACSARCTVTVVKAAFEADGLSGSLEVLRRLGINDDEEEGTSSIRHAWGVGEAIVGGVDKTMKQ